MKKTKILIPTLSFASVGAIVAPIATMTSCKSSSLLTVTDLNYVGTMHEFVEAGDNAWTLNKANEEYYKENGKFIIEDVVTTFASQYGKGGFNNYKGHKNVNFNYYVTINNIEIGEEKVVKDETEGHVENNLKGHMVSGNISIGYNVSFDLTQQELKDYSTYSNYHKDITWSRTISFKNCFASLGYNNGWKVYIEGVKDASDEWEFSIKTSTSTKNIATLNYDGSVDSWIETTETSKSDGAKCGGLDQSITNSFSSNYLSKVAHKD